MAVPTVTFVSPNAGVPTAGTSVQVIGTNFISGATVNFGPSNPATNVVVSSATLITCTAPAGTGTVDVRVTTSGGTSAANAPADQFTFSMPVPADPNTTANAIALFNLLYDLTFEQPGFTVSGNPMRLVGQILDGQDVWDAVKNGTSQSDMYARATKAFNMWKLTTGKTPAFMDAAINYLSAASLSGYYTPQGVAQLDWAAVLPALSAFAQTGGIVGIQNSFLNIPTQYYDQGTLSTGGGNTSVSAINTAGTITLSGINTSKWPALGGNFKIIGQTSPNPTCLLGSYTSRSGSVLSGVVLTGSGSTVIDNGAVVYVSQLSVAAIGTTMTAAESAGAFPLQYRSTAYQDLPQAAGVNGGGSNTIGGCLWTGGAHTATVTTTGNTATMPIVVGMYVFGTGIPSGATVSSVTDATHFVLTASSNFTSESGQTLTFTLGKNDGSDYVAALLEDANANLNAMLDQVILGFGPLALLGIPVIFRHLSECNITSNWTGWSAANCLWWPYLFAYCHGYITGNQWFAGQPVSATPVHNLLFVWAPYAEATAPTGLPPIINNKVFCDILGVDLYANPPNLYAANLGPGGLSGVPGCAALPHAFTEVFGGVVTATNEFPQGYCRASSYSSGTVDLSTATTLDLDYLPDWPTAGPAQAANFSSGTILVPTSNGLQSVTYSSATNSGVLPCTLTLSSTAGVPAGSYIQSKGCASQPVAITADNCGTATFLTNIKLKMGWYMTWWGQFNQMYADLSGMSTLIGDSTAIPLENLRSYFSAPWRPGLNRPTAPLGRHGQVRTHAASRAATF